MQKNSGNLTDKKFLAESNVILLENIPKQAEPLPDIFAISAPLFFKSPIISLITGKDEFACISRSFGNFKISFSDIFDKNSSPISFENLPDRLRKTSPVLRLILG